MEYGKEFTVFVGNLNEKVTKDLLFEIFLQMGPIVNCAIIDPSRILNSKNNEKNDANDLEELEKVDAEKPYRYGFVVFEHSDSVLFACKMLKDVHLYGDRLTVRPRNRIEQKERFQETKDNTHLVAPVRREKSKEFVSRNNHVPVLDKKTPRNPKIFYNSHYRPLFSHSSPEVLTIKNFPPRENERGSICGYRSIPKFAKRDRMALIKS
ncbi:hypothetical protein FO519_005429 [Halicephalobus sp. NKZ332]|nr:hypothetical protein FO519_005429 [Halicephalobus sp. NKZ332]